MVFTDVTNTNVPFNQMIIIIKMKALVIGSKIIEMIIAGVRWGKGQCLRSLSLFQRNTWWRHQMETFSALLAICAGNSPVPGDFPAQRPVTRSFDVFFDLRLNKRLSKQSWGVSMW